MWTRLRALFLLAWALVKSVVRRLASRPGAGLAAFRRNFDAEGLTPVAADERGALATFSGCIACGLCDHGEAPRIAASGGEYRGVMAIVLSASRSMPEFLATHRSLRHVPESVLLEKERICPAHVPIARIARFVRQRSGAAQDGSLAT